MLYYNISQLKTFRILQEVRGKNQRTEEATSLGQGTQKNWKGVKKVEKHGFNKPGALHSSSSA